jgi:DNA polymerase III sliding clamp (beta) subunit (PCNA family)
MPVFLPKNLAALAGVAAKEATRYSANALRVLDLGGAYRVEATDGTKLVVVRGPCPESSSLALGPEYGGANEALVPAADWKAGFRLGKKQLPVGLAADATSFKLAVGDQAVSGQRAEGRFPDFSLVIPKAPALIGFRVDPSLLIGLLQAAAALEPVGGVQVLFYARNKPIGIACRNDQGQYLDGLLMPLA